MEALSIAIPRRNSHLEGASVLSFEEGRHQRQDHAQQLPFPLKPLRCHEESRLARRLSDPLSPGVELRHRLFCVFFFNRYEREIRRVARVDEKNRKSQFEETQVNRGQAMGRGKDTVANGSGTDWSASFLAWIR